MAGIEHGWRKIGEKFNLSAAEAEVKFRKMRTAYDCFLKRLKTIRSGSGQDAAQQNSLLEVHHVVCCDFPTSTTRVYI